MPRETQGFGLNKSIQHSGYVFDKEMTSYYDRKLKISILQNTPPTPLMRMSGKEHLFANNTFMLLPPVEELLTWHPGFPHTLPAVS